MRPRTSHMKGKFFTAKRGRLIWHARQSIYSKRFSRGQNRYGAGADFRQDGVTLVPHDEPTVYGGLCGLLFIVHHGPLVLITHTATLSRSCL